MWALRVGITIYENIESNRFRGSRAIAHGGEIDTAAGGTRMSKIEAETKKSSGLAGVVAGKSSVSFIDGEKGILRYSGYDIHDLAEESSGHGDCTGNHGQQDQADE